MTRSACVMRTPATVEVDTLRVEVVEVVLSWSVAAPFVEDALRGAAVLSAPFLAAAFAPRAGASSRTGGMVATSRRTAFAGLSSRRPSNDGWRRLPSGVHSEKLISATSSGLTQ